MLIHGHEAVWQYGVVMLGFWAAAAPWIVQGIGAAVSYFGSRSAANASTEAAGIQADAANKAIDLQAQIYAQQRQDQAPWLHYGTEALTTMGSLMGLGGFTGAQIATPGLTTAPGAPYGGSEGIDPGEVPGSNNDPSARQDQGFGWTQGQAPGQGSGPDAIPMTTIGQQSPPIRVQMPDGSIIGVQAYELKDAIRLGGRVVTEPGAQTLGELSDTNVVGTNAPRQAATGTVGDIPTTPGAPTAPRGGYDQA